MIGSIFPIRHRGMPLFAVLIGSGPPVWRPPNRGRLPAMVLSATIIGVRLVFGSHLRHLAATGAHFAEPIEKL